MKSHAGFTLIEVMVALAIVAFGLAALMTTVSQSARNTDYLREKTLAGWVAINKITEARLAGQAPADKEQKGTVEFANQTWRWELKTVSSGVPGIVRLEARSAPESAPKGSWPGQAAGFIGSAVAPSEVASAYSDVPKPQPGPGNGTPTNQPTTDENGR